MGVQPCPLVRFVFISRTKLDSEAKKWRYARRSGLCFTKFVQFGVFLKVLLDYFCRLFADILNDVAMFMEILAPYFPAFFTFIMCVSGIFKVRQTSDDATNLFIHLFNYFYHYNLAG